jgi:hypothetical protein
LSSDESSNFSKIRWSNEYHGKMCAVNERGDTSILSFEPEGLKSNPNKPYSVPKVLQSTNEPYVPKWN